MNELNRLKVLASINTYPSQTNFTKSTPIIDNFTHDDSNKDSILTKSTPLKVVDTRKRKICSAETDKVMNKSSLFVNDDDGKLKKKMRIK